MTSARLQGNLGAAQPLSELGGALCGGNFVHSDLEFLPGAPQFGGARRVP